LTNNPRPGKGSQIRNITRAGVCSALAAALSVTSMCWSMPGGGEISLRILPLLFAGIIFGPITGLYTGVSYSVLNLMMGAKIFHWVQAFMDYLFPFAIAGLCGIFMGRIFFEQAKGFSLFRALAGVSLVWILRLISHTLSGVIFFNQGSLAFSAAFKASVLYNLSWLAPELILSIVFLFFFPFSRIAGALKNRSQEL
jgi:thiamine transporter